MSKMQLAHCRLLLAKDGSDVPMYNVTPAEVMFLVAEHKGLGRCPVTDIQLLDEVDRTPREERDRLLGKYASRKVMAAFPGAIPNVPTTFDEALLVGEEVTLPKVNFVDHDLSKGD